jgi:virulence-associated protein VapD
MRPKRPQEIHATSLTSSSFTEKKTVYAITFDLDTNTLQQAYNGPSWNNAYREIADVLRAYGFERMQGSVYFGDASVTPVTCVIATMALTRALPWFASSIRDIRMLRIEDNNDLMPAILDAVGAGTPHT